ncbi:hypothetical protein ABT214_28040 [Micromonospora purpureochromogenes]|uniref:hypothetical protein n=1 Tax=Micromonospora purpureochromogenes TaxID=47872 RepID=UPI00331A35B1
MASTVYTDSPAAREALHRRTLIVVMASQVFSGAGLAAGVTVGALLAADMLGTSNLSVLPTALFTAGSAGAALMVGRLGTAMITDRPGHHPAGHAATPDRRHRIAGSTACHTGRHPHGPHQPGP